MIKIVPLHLVNRVKIVMIIRRLSAIRPLLFSFVLKVFLRIEQGSFRVIHDHQIAFTVWLFLVHDVLLLIEVLGLVKDPRRRENRQIGHGLVIYQSLLLFDKKLVFGGMVRFIDDIA